MTFAKAQGPFLCFVGKNTIMAPPLLGTVNSHQRVPPPISGSEPNTGTTLATHAGTQATVARSLSFISISI